VQRGVSRLARFFLHQKGAQNAGFAMQLQVEGEGVFLAQSGHGHIPPMQKFLEKRSDRQKRTDQNRNFF
jgi:hypothetical protein